MDVRCVSAVCVCVRLCVNFCDSSLFVYWQDSVDLCVIIIDTILMFYYSANDNLVIFGLYKFKSENDIKVKISSMRAFCKIMYISQLTCAAVEK